MNLSLFSNKPEESGFRLHTYEVWNWGTFDKEIWSIHPNGETTLLTGANASGKTTLVDGLLTLLVPERRMRFYNQTAGAKGDRTEESYVVGEYGETENAESNTREIRKLRPEKSQAQSIILAVFQNENHYVTLVQTRWFSGSDLKKNFILAHTALSIEKDFSPFDNESMWKKTLRLKYPKQGNKEVIHIMDSPVEYGRLMQKTFGMRSEKAHTLFSQTIGLKVLGSLDDFVRVQMLEEGNSEHEFQKIKTHFKTLSDAHKSIEKAHKQIELLSPIRDKNVVILELNRNIDELENHQQAAPYFFSKEQKQLGEAFIDLKKREETELSFKIEQTDAELSDLSNQERNLDLQIQSDAVGAQINELIKKNKELSRIHKERQVAIDRYNRLAQTLGFEPNPQSEELFKSQRESGVAKKKAIHEQVAKLEDNHFDVRKQESDLNESFTKITEELNLLRSQKNNITGVTASIRNQILEITGASEQEIPFVGELIKVNVNAGEWEAAIERLLHNFALTILVPVQYYKKVNSYIHNNNLKGRIVYQKVDLKSIPPTLFPEYDNDELVHKLEFKDSPYSQWITNEIDKRFKYRCIENLEDFALADKALTKTGLIKNANRHEKDDRPEVHGRQRFVLGWDNQEKITVLKALAEELDENITRNTNRISQIKQQLNHLEADKEAVILFAEFQLYASINWWLTVKEIKQNERTISDLQSTSDHIAVLHNQHAALLERIKLKKIEQQDLITNKVTTGQEIKHQQEEIRKADSTLEKYSGLVTDEILEAFKKSYIQETVLSLDSLAAQLSITTTKIMQEISQKKDSSRLEVSAVEKLMRNFTNPDQEIWDRFEDWSSDTHRLRDNILSIEDYIKLLDRIEKQELAQHKLKFKNYLNEEMITQMSSFQTWLEEQEDHIETNIEMLNGSLFKIDFKTTPTTFIQIKTDRDYSPKIKDFRIKINDWKPNLGEYEKTKDSGILEESFRKIKELLDELTQDETTRRYVLDVRNWLKFKAVEFYRENPSQVARTYTGTAKLSGGEGTQLTYTILSSAIAYQFGIHAEGLNTNSFRFICVDEAFSKQDDEKSRFLMELCKQLHLQVMVVSPAKAEEVAIVEPYIAGVHFVQRKNNRNSVVYDMSVKILQEERANYFENQVI